MKNVVYRLLISAFVALVCHPAHAADLLSTETTQEKPTISFSEEMDDAIVQEASRVKEDFKQQARSLFERQPLGWNWDTISYLSKWLFSLPQQLPEFTKQLTG